MAKKLFIKTHGCQMNEYDSSRMADLLGDSHEMEITSNEAEADIILLNSVQTGLLQPPLIGINGGAIGGEECGIGSNECSR